MNPRKMQQMMKQLGIQQQEIAATEVIIKTADKEIVITNPSVAKVNMMGQETFQISGEIQERELSSSSSSSSSPSSSEISEEDLNTVMEQTGASEEEARKALDEAEGDLAEAILKLKK